MSFKSLYNKIEYIINELKKSFAMRVCFVMLIISFIIIFILSLIIAKNIKKNDYITNIVRIFIQPYCDKCRDVIDFVENNKYKYKNIIFKIYNLKDIESKNIFFDYVRRNNILESNLETPFIIINNQYIIGYDDTYEKDFKTMLHNLNKFYTNYTY